MRDPSDPGWPESGEQTEFQGVAEEWAREYQRYYRERERKRQLGLTPTLGEASKRYIGHRRSCVSPNTVYADRAMLKHLLGDVPPDKPLPEVASETIHTAVSRKISSGYARGTVRGWLLALKRMWRHFDLPEPDVETPQQDRRAVVYFVQCTVTQKIKIGKTENLARRVRTLRSTIPTTLEVLGTVDGGRRMERALHKRLKEYRTHGEWFEPTEEVMAVVEEYAGG